jgi:hypothetical protein
MYKNVGLMQLGEGYWLKTSTPSTLFLGNEVTSNTLSGLSGIGQAPAYGWNMVGGISHAVPIASIVQTPANCMKAIFGWDPASGYIIPTSVMPGIGYWVRTVPDATLGLSGTTVRSGGVTAYEKAAAGITAAGVVTVLTGDSGGQILTLADRKLSPEETDILGLPSVPPGMLFDARSDNGTLFLAPGENTVLLQNDGEVKIAVTPHDGVLRDIHLLDENGAVLYSFRTDQPSVITVDVSGSRTVLLRYGIVEQSALHFALDQNYPNPIRAGTNTAIRYSIDADGPVRLEVYDLLGRRVSTLVDDVRRPGRYAAAWNGMDENGSMLPSGLYMYRLEAAGKSQTRRCTIVR